MNVSLRIKTIAGLIKYERAADIGTGDGLTVIYALKTNKIKKAVACDLNAEPVEIARRNAREYGVVEIEFRQCHGLDGLNPGEAETVIIAGMGGLLTADILRGAGRMPEDVKQLILQPQSAVPEVRKSVHESGFIIDDELIIKERGKFYFVLDCRRGHEEKYPDHDYMFGRFLPRRRDDVFIEYLKKEARLLETVRTRIKAGTETGRGAAERLGEIERLLGVIRGIID